VDGCNLRKLSGGGVRLNEAPTLSPLHSSPKESADWFIVSAHRLPTAKVDQVAHRKPEAFAPYKPSPTTRTGPRRQGVLLSGGCHLPAAGLDRSPLHALATATGHQADAIVAQRRLPISMTDDTGKPFQIRRKSLLARLGATPAHVSLIS
jgi:hypothetical protein